MCSSDFPREALSRLLSEANVASTVEYLPFQIFSFVMFIILHEGID